MVDIKKVHEDGSVAKFLVKGTTPTFMNSLRRTIMVNTPCLAVDSVSFFENDSVVFDEMLAHRLGLLPIKTDIKTYKEGDEVKLVLEKEGPCVVTSKDIKCTDPKIEILDKKMIITKLAKGHNIKVEMKAIMKTGKEHARYQPAIVSYNEVPIINNDVEYKHTKEILESLPKGSVEAKAGKLFFSDPYNIKLQNQPIDALAKHGVKVDFSPTDFVLTIESTGQLTTKEVVELALTRMDESLEKLSEAVKKV